MQNPVVDTVVFPVEKTPVVFYAGAHGTLSTGSLSTVKTTG